MYGQWNSGPSAARRAIGELDTKSGFVFASFKQATHESAVPCPCPTCPCIRQTSAWVPRIHSCRSRHRKAPDAHAAGAIWAPKPRLRSTGVGFRPFRLILRKPDRHALALSALAEAAGYRDTRPPVKSRGLSWMDRLRVRLPFGAEQRPCLPPGCNRRPCRLVRPPSPQARRPAGSGPDGCRCPRP